MTRALLALEDGMVLEGRAFGALGETAGEVVFNTSLTGYQEVLTDPSYCGQIVAMTSPHIGNYGITPEDMESARPQVAGFVVKELSPVASSYRSTEDLDAFLKRAGICGIEGVDTRALTRHLRTRGTVRGIVTTREGDAAALVERAKRAPLLEEQDLVSRVTLAKPAPWREERPSPLFHPPGDGSDRRFRVAAMDFGAKTNILRCLASVGCDVTVFPATADAKEILALRPDGIFLSNGPGDPQRAAYAIRSVRDLAGKAPIFGICLGHQILALAFGARTYKLKFGHRGANHPVKDLATGRVEITTQNHGFAADPDSLQGAGLELTHTSLNDGTVEGMRHRDLPIFSVQFHPEASAGPHDSSHLFVRFREMMRERSGKSAEGAP